MKIFRKRNCLRGPSGITRHNEDGLATVVFIALLAIMMLIVIANSAALIHLHREVRLLEQQQLKRLNGLQTNSMPVALNVLPPKAP